MKQNYTNLVLSDEELQMVVGGKGISKRDKTWLTVLAYVSAFCGPAIGFVTSINGWMWSGL